MSLRPDDRSSRTRDRSSTRDRSRSRSHVRAPSPPSAVPRSYGYPAGQQQQVPGSNSNGVDQATYEIRAPEQVTSSSYYQPTAAPNAPYPADGFTMGGYTDLPPHERPGYIPPEQYARHHGDDDDDSDDPALAYGNTSRHSSRQSSYTGNYPTQQTQLPSGASAGQYRYPPPPSAGPPQPQYQNFQYAQPPEKITYTAKPHATQQQVQYSQDNQDRRRPDLPRDYGKNSYGQDARIVDITPGAVDFTRDRDRDRKSSTSQSHRLSVSTGLSALQAPPSPGLGSRMSRLSVSGNRPDLHAAGGAGGLPPPSPLLEAYHGTYQSISPMPTAMRLDNDDIDDLPSLDYPSAHSKQNKVTMQDKEKKRVKLYDPEADARALASALNSSKVDTDAVCDILPPLSDDQVWELRKQYKKQVKIQGKGINLSKHLKMKLSGNFGKVAYVTALGRWESEGYWANFFYQSHASRRELVIESLMGRSNADVRSIKDDFKDKRYNDDLIRCMEKELKMDKFRTAVLMALEGRRQEEQDVYPQEYRDRDVDVLTRSVRAREGGESAMLEIVIRRSDAHLREILRQYELMQGENFARVALKKSNNLVGEVIAHILNGVINKPARDALLLRHAIKDIAAHNKSDDLRYELLISRLVRLHWDRLHLARVKREYKEKYGKHLEEDLEDCTKGDFREFVCELCQVQGPR